MNVLERSIMRNSHPVMRRGQQQRARPRCMTPRLQLFAMLRDRAVQQATVPALGYSLVAPACVSGLACNVSQSNVWLCTMQPMPAGSTVLCTASLESVHRRKAWLTAELRDRPGGALFSSARALYLIANSPPPQLAGEFEFQELKKASNQ